MKSRNYLFFCVAETGLNRFVFGVNWFTVNLLKLVTNFECLLLTFLCRIPKSVRNSIKGSFFSKDCHRITAKLHTESVFAVESFCFLTLPKVCHSAPCWGHAPPAEQWHFLQLQARALGPTWQSTGTQPGHSQPSGVPGLWSRQPIWRCPHCAPHDRQKGALPHRATHWGEVCSDRLWKSLWMGSTEPTVYPDLQHSTLVSLLPLCGLLPPGHDHQRLHQHCHHLHWEAFWPAQLPG